jgi:hypothetical protein
LLDKLSSRTSGSVEFKHCNISAVLIDLGFPYIKGYQPRFNYQSLLREVVEHQVSRFTELDNLALSAVLQPAVSPATQNYEQVLVDAPIRKHVAADVGPATNYTPTKRDYLAREAHNMSLGLAGEEFIIQYEHWRLNHLGLGHLADRIEHVSQTKGDGLGYDILSYDATGRERLIEVKTTSFGKDTPFFVSKNELNLSRDLPEQFYLCRVFEFRQSPRMFSLRGQIDAHCTLDPVTFRASI